MKKPIILGYTQRADHIRFAWKISEGSPIHIASCDNTGGMIDFFMYLEVNYYETNTDFNEFVKSLIG